MLGSLGQLTFTGVQNARSPCVTEWLPAKVMTFGVLCQTVM